MGGGGNFYFDLHIFSILIFRRTGSGDHRISQNLMIRQQESETDMVSHFVNPSSNYLLTTAHLTALTPISITYLHKRCFYLNHIILLYQSRKPKHHNLQKQCYKSKLIFININSKNITLHS